MASHETPSNKSKLNGDYTMKKCKSSNTRVLHLYEPVANNSILRAEMTNPRERTEMSIEKFRSHVVF